MTSLDSPRCQLHCALGQAPPGQGLRRLISALRHRLRLRSRWRAWRHGPPPEGERLGTASRFAAGSWVRIREPGEIFATLNPGRCLRGLPWVWQQWPYCGSVHQVLKPVRRIMDDAQRMRPVSGTVVLDSVPCSGPLGDHGCGRACPMMFRDEWLEPAQPPASVPAAPPALGYATVRSEAEIRAGLDRRNLYRGLLFMPEMAAFAGQRLPVRQRLVQVFEGGRQVPVREPLYLLDGLFCQGAALAADGPCERACRLLWHADWLIFDSPPAAASSPIPDRSVT